MSQLLGRRLRIFQRIANAALDSRVTLVGLIIAIVGVAFMLGGHPVIGVMLLLLAWVLVMLDGPLEF